MAPAPGRTNDQYFRGHHIDKIAQKTSWRYPWSTADRLFFSKLAARYQITDRSNVSLGLDEVARKLGISDRSDYYKSAVLGRAKAAILYLVQHKFRGGETRILVETGETVRGEAVWKWPQYSLRWLKPDWDGNIWPLNGDDRKSTRRDTPGVRASTPEPNRRAGPYVSGGRGPGTRTPSPSTRRARAFSPTPGPDERSWTRSGTYLDHDSDDGGTGIYHDSEDDEAHFSDSSTRTMRPSRVFWKRHKRGGQEAEAEASITSFVKQELQEQQTKLDNKFNAMIDVVKDLCTMSRGKDRAASEQEKAKKRLDVLPPPPTEDPMPYMPTPPSTPPSSYHRPSFYVPQDSPPRKPASARDVRWWFPDVPDEVANLDRGRDGDGDDTSIQDAVRLSRPSTKTPTPIRWAFYAVFCYLLAATLMALFLPRPSLTPESGILQPRTIEAPTIHSALPIYERFQDLSYRYASVSQSYPTHLFASFRTEDEPAVAVVDDICQALHYLGSIWSEDQGLRLNGREYYQYTKRRDAGEVSPLDGVDLYHLCYSTRDSLDRIADLASDIISNVMIAFPLQALGALGGLVLDFVFRAEDKNASGATTETSTAEPAADGSPLEAIASLSRTIDEFGLNIASGDSVLDLSDQLRRRIMNATQKIDQLLDIAERVGRNQTETGKQPFWASILGRDGQDDDVKLRRNLSAKASSTTISGVKANLTLLSSAAQRLAGQVDEILLEEDKLYTWLKDLLDWATLRDTDQKTQKIPLAGTWYNDPWIKRRPSAEKAMFGRWCVQPECPEPGDEETVLVELYVPNVEDAGAELYNTYLLTLRARYIAQKKAFDL